MSSSLYEYTQHEKSIAAFELEKQRLESSYMNIINALEKQILEIETSIENSKSEVKKDILTKKSTYLQERIAKIDEGYASNRADIEKVQQSLRTRMEKLKSKIDGEKTSYEHNIQKLKNYRDNLESYTMSQLLEPIVNIIEIMREQNETGQTHERKP